MIVMIIISIPIKPKSIGLSPLISSPSPSSPKPLSLNPCPIIKRAHLHQAQIHQVYALLKPKPSPHLLPHLRRRRRGKWKWERQRRRASKSVQAARCPRRCLDYRRPCRVLRRIPALALKLVAAAWRGACYCCLYRRARGLLLRQRRSDG